jgi:hypothetical protein
MSNGGLDVNMVILAMANIIAEGQDKDEILFAIHFLGLLQNALRSYIF